MCIGLGTLDLAWLGLTLGSILGHGSWFYGVQGLGTRVELGARGKKPYIFLYKNIIISYLMKIQN